MKLLVTSVPPTGLSRVSSRDLLKSAIFASGLKMGCFLAYVERFPCCWPRWLQLLPTTDSAKGARKIEVNFIAVIQYSFYTATNESQQTRDLASIQTLTIAHLHFLLRKLQVRLPSCSLCVALALWLVYIRGHFLFTRETSKDTLSRPRNLLTVVWLEFVEDLR